MTDVKPPVKAEIEGDDDDEVVATYDVFAAQQLTGCLHIFQYPLRPITRPYEMSRVKLFATKGVAAAQQQQQQQQGGTAAATTTFDRDPGLVQPTSRFTMNIELDTFGSDSFRERQDDDPYGGARGEARPFCYQLESVPFQKRSEYAVGVIRDGEIHLTPVTAVQQFTPVAKARSTKITSEDLLSRVANTTTSVGGAVQSTLDRQLRRLRSVALAEDFGSREPWDFFPSATVESKTVAQRLQSSTIANSVSAASLQPGQRRVDPVDAFFPRDTTRDIGSTLRKHVVARYAENYAVAHQVEDLLRSCQIVHLLMLMAHVRVPGGEPAPLQDIVATLRRRAVYMHGLWVAAECNKYQLNDAAVREVTLLHFARSPDGTVARRDINALFPRNPTVLPGIKRTLDDVAELLPHADPSQRRWRLKYMEAAAESAAIMQQRFPEDVARQQKTWQARHDEIRAHAAIINSGRIVPTRNLRLFDAAGAAAGAAAGGGAGAHGPQQHGGIATAATTAAARAAPASAEVDPKRREELLVAARETIRRMFRAHGVINRQVAKEHLRSLTKRPADRLHQCPDAVLVDALKAELMPFTESTWILQRPENDAGSEYRRFLIAAMRQKGEFTLKDCVDRATALLHHELQTKGESVADRTIEAAGATVVASELAEYHQGERLWHVKSGMVKLL